MHISPVKAGLSVGAFLGLFHAVWASLVALNWAQALMDFVFNLHMIHPLYTVGPFSLAMAGGLVVFTTLVGFVCGYVFALIANRFHRA